MAWHCWKPGAPVQLSRSDNPNRKLAWTLERVDMGQGWIGVNTNRVNHIIAQAIENKAIDGLGGYSRLKREPAFSAAGHPGSRFDMLLSGGNRPDAYIEVKNTTLVSGDGIVFPDAVTERGRKHLLLLEEAVKLGFRGIMLYALNRPEGKYFGPAWNIDPEYGHTLERVARNGVEVLVVRLKHVDQVVKVAGSAMSRVARSVD